MSRPFRGSRNSPSRFPNDIPAVFLLIGAEAALARVVRETAHPGAPVQGADRVRGQRAIAHRRNIENGGCVRLFAGRPANRNAKRLTRRLFGRDRMRQPFEARFINVIFGAERPLIEFAFCALIDNGTFIARKGRAPSLSLSKKYCRISGRMASRKKRICAAIG